MHRIIAETPDDMLCDHEDHDTLNNQKHNLRNCSKSQNGANRKKTKLITTSKYKGVYFALDKVKRNNKEWLYERWHAQVGKKRASRHLKEIDAALAYNEKAKEVFGEFAHLNVVPPVRFTNPTMHIPCTT